MSKAGFTYNNPEETEPDIEDRFDDILDGSKPEDLSALTHASLLALQDEERMIAVVDLECEFEFVEPAISLVEIELYGAPQP